MERFKKEMALTPEVNRILDQDMELGRKVGVEGTPTIFVNGKLAQDRSYDYFVQQLMRAKKSGLTALLRESSGTFLLSDPRAFRPGFFFIRLSGNLSSDKKPDAFRPITGPERMSNVQSKGRIPAGIPKDSTRTSNSRIIRNWLPRKTVISRENVKDLEEEARKRSRSGDAVEDAGDRHHKIELEFTRNNDFAGNEAALPTDADFSRGSGFIGGKLVGEGASGEDYTPVPTSRIIRPRDSSRSADQERNLEAIRREESESAERLVRPCAGSGNRNRPRPGFPAAGSGHRHPGFRTGCGIHRFRPGGKGRAGRQPGDASHPRRNKSFGRPFLGAWGEAHQGLRRTCS